MEDVGDDEADEQIDDGVDEALAELGEVLHQAHAGEFGAVGDGFAARSMGSRSATLGGLGGRDLRRRTAVWIGGRDRGDGVETGESEELLTGRPVEGGMRLRSPEVAMGSGSDGSTVTLTRLLLSAARADGRRGTRSVAGAAMVFSVPSAMAGVTGAAASMAAIFFLLLRLVGDAELFFHLHAELVGGAAELGHELAELAGEFGQLLRPEEKQGEEERWRCPES